MSDVRFKKKEHRNTFIASLFVLAASDLRRGRYASVASAMEACLDHLSEGSKPACLAVDIWKAAVVRTAEEDVFMQRAGAGKRHMSDALTKAARELAEAKDTRVLDDAVLPQLAAQLDRRAKRYWSAFKK